MVSRELLKILRCPVCSQPVAPTYISGSFEVACVSGHIYPVRDGYVDLHIDVMGRESLYQQADFPVDPSYTRIGPAVLGAGVRLWMLEKYLSPYAGAWILDIGCGNGKFAYWLKRRGIKTFGIDIAAHFASEAVKEVDLVRADSRRLPFPDNCFHGAYSIDVLEHFDMPSLKTSLREAYRVLAPGGRLFVFSNTREPSALRPLIAPSAWMQRKLVDAGIMDGKWDRLRKADHVKAVATIEEAVSLMEWAGFTILVVAYWNTVFTGLFENVLVKLAEGIISRRGKAIEGGNGSSRWRRPVVASKPLYRLPLRLLTEIAKLDMILFGSFRAGPFFLLAEKPARNR